VPKKKKDSNYLKLKKLWRIHNIAKGDGDLESAKKTGKKIVNLQRKMNIGYVADFTHLEEIKL
jgi:hypothetical protein